jgi:hypothetical protein
LFFACFFVLLCGLVDFEALYWGTLVLLLGVVVFPFCLGVLALCVHFVIGNVLLCFIVFFGFSVFLCFCVFILLVLFSLTFQRTLGSFMMVAFRASWALPERP